MRDGTRLVADITLPVGEGPWPTFLIRTPYGRDPEAASDYAKRGYASVVQACRGRDGSEGVWGAWEDDKDYLAGRRTEAAVGLCTTGLPRSLLARCALLEAPPVVRTRSRSVTSPPASTTHN